MVFWQRSRDDSPRGGTTHARTTAPGLDSFWLGPDITPRAQGMARSLLLPPAERVAVDEAIREKASARRSLLRRALSLSRHARDEARSEQELARTVAEYERARAAFRQEIARIDARLARHVSLRSRVRLLASGVLDNGLGFMAGEPLSADRH